MKKVRFASSYIEPYPLQIVGEQSYRDEIEEVTGYTGELEGINADDFIAQLILDDNNLVDPGNAVAVEINGKTVGYLSKGNAKKYRKRLKEIGLGDVIGECYASIRGGFERRDGGIADFGVRLDLIIDEMKVYTPPPPKPAQPIIETENLANPINTIQKEQPKKFRLTPKDWLVVILLGLLGLAGIISWFREFFNI